MTVRPVAAVMRVRTYIYNSETAADPVEAVLERLDERDESIDRQDVAAADDRTDALREAMLTVRESVRIGENPDGIYDEDGNPDFSSGVLVTEAATGRRNLYVGRDALEALDSESDDAAGGR